MSLIRKHGAVLQAWACLDLVKDHCYDHSSTKYWASVTQWHWRRSVVYTEAARASRRCENETPQASSEWGMEMGIPLPGQLGL